LTVPEGAQRVACVPAQLAALIGKLVATPRMRAWRSVTATAIGCEVAREASSMIPFTSSGASVGAVAQANGGCPPAPESSRTKVGTMFLKGTAMESHHFSLAGKRAVVTGGAGFLGRVVVRKLAERGCAEVAVPRRSSCDLRRADDVARMLDAAQPDFVIHLAGAVGDPASDVDVGTKFCDNVLMATQLIDAAARRGIPKMAVVGSASSYPASAPMPLREQDLFNGLPDASRLPYGIAKRMPVIHAYACRLQFGFRCISLIPTNFYGPGDYFDATTSYVIPALVRRFVELERCQSQREDFSGFAAERHGKGNRRQLAQQPLQRRLVVARLVEVATQPLN